MEQVRKNKKCEICPYATNTNQNLKKHKKTHEKVTPLINDCWECDKTFTTKKSLTDHMRTHNKKDKSINCELCEFKTDRKFNLKLEKLSTIQSHTSFNSKRVGSPNRIMSIKKKSPNSPLARVN